MNLISGYAAVFTIFGILTALLPGLGPIIGAALAGGSIASAMNDTKFTVIMWASVTAGSALSTWIVWGFPLMAILIIETGVAFGFWLFYLVARKRQRRTVGTASKW